MICRRNLRIRRKKHFASPDNERHIESDLVWWKHIRARVLPQKKAFWCWTVITLQFWNHRQIYSKLKLVRLRPKEKSSGDSKNAFVIILINRPDLDPDEPTITWFRDDRMVRVLTQKQHYCCKTHDRFFLSEFLWKSSDKSANTKGKPSLLFREKTNVLPLKIWKCRQRGKPFRKRIEWMYQPKRERPNLNRVRWLFMTSRTKRSRRKENKGGTGEIWSVWGSGDYRASHRPSKKIQGTVIME
jgi:hypothetical protein